MIRTSRGLLLSLLFTAAPLSANILYRVTDLGTLGGANSLGYGINQVGQVTGEAYTPIGASHAFLYNHGQMTDLGTLGGAYSIGDGINDAGQVTGSASTSTGDPHPFLYSNGQMSDLGTLGGSSSYGNAINNAGQITGVSNDRAFLYSNGQMTDLGILGDVSSIGKGINNAGQVTGITFSRSGFRSFLYSNGQLTYLTDLGAIASAINDRGQVAGLYGNHAFLYSDGQMINLGRLPGGNYSTAEGLNNLGQVTGFASTSDNLTHAFLYSNGQIEDLNDLIDPALHLTLTEATAINDSGQIVVNAGLRSSGVHAYLLTPTANVPEPSTLALFGVALLGLGAWARVARVGTP